MSTRSAPVVSVVIPTRNGAAHIAWQLDALSEQRLDGGFEVIVADNGSTDATVEIASRYAERCDLRIIDASALRGAAFARNAGAADARAVRLVFLDDDDVVTPGYLAAMAAALDRFPFVAARVDGRTLNPEWRADMRTVDLVEGLRKGPGFTWALSCALGITREAFDAVGGFDAALAGAGEDVDLGRRMHEAGIELHLVPDAVVQRRLRTSRRAVFNQARRYAIGARERHGRLEHPYRGLSGAFRLMILGRNRSERARGIYLLGRVVGQVQIARRGRP